LFAEKLKGIESKSGKIIATVDTVATAQADPDRFGCGLLFSQ